MSKYRAAGPAETDLGRVVRSPKTRLYLYGIAGAGSPIAVAYGLISESEAGLWIALAGAVLSTGGHALASANVPTPPAD